MNAPESPLRRAGEPAPMEMDPETFRTTGRRMVDAIADFLASLPDRPVTPGETPAEVRRILGRGGLPETGTDAGRLLEETTRLVLEHSAFNGHPGFLAYITSSAAPIGALGDLLGAAVNPNLGGWPLSPIGCEIEAQTVCWVAELIGYPPDCGGLLVSGGNLANMIGLWVARNVKTGWDLRKEGITGRRLRLYVSEETHTWIQKAADLSGLGTDAVRWIPTGPDLSMDPGALAERIAADRAAGDLPVMVVGTAGSTATGAVDPLVEIAALCHEQDLWFHVDGAYGAPAAVLPEAPEDLKALRLADSVAVDPHKWLYAPLEAGCVLVRDAQLLRDTFSYHPPYYPKDREGAEVPWTMYHELGPQNSRGFRALKVWLGLRQVGRAGFERMIREDIALARHLFEAAGATPELEARTLGLSVATFRFVPSGVPADTDGGREYLNTLNQTLLERLQTGGKVYLSNAVVRGDYLLRACVVNFRTAREHMEAIPSLVVDTGRALDAELRPAEFRS